MSYLIVLFIILSGIGHLFVLNKINKTRREMSGLPIGTTFPNYNKRSNSQRRHVVIAVSTTCTVCQRLFKTFSKMSDTTHITLVFVDEPPVVEAFIAQHPHLKRINIVTRYNRDDLFLKSTPLAFILNQQDIIIDKISLVSLKEIET
ncbi:Uncharacterised protein [Staphylococcus agnetis]|uniref:hypothetical protein n=1 Tax=Staphylococcus agnetis TaxID=985762 RepID=UPI000DFFBD4F|nr:hypothetical protein [Staphylococcus agnetis]SUK15721.1 Uncharacterised protein [Staphylococcus agnetis]